MSKQALQGYIQDAHQAGMSNQQIMQELTAAGWQVHDLLDLILEPKSDILMPAIISVQNLSKSYGQVKALDNVTLEIHRGRVTALLGPNGAGKTTLIRILTTLLPATSGQATVAGLDVVSNAQKLRGIIGLAGQSAAVDETLTGRENLEMFGRLYHLPGPTAKARAAELLRQFNLEEAADRIVKTYSGGMRRRLDLAASLVIRPQVLFLDEPTSGLDPRSRFALWNVIRDLVADGTTVLLTTQYMEEADQLAQYIFVIDHGHIITQGTSDTLKNQVGGDILELHLVNHSEAAPAAATVRQFGTEAAHADPATGIVTVPIKGGSAVLVEVVRQLDIAGLKVLDVILRRPSLDDVFLKLTGHGTE